MFKSECTVWSDSSGGFSVTFPVNGQEALFFDSYGKPVIFNKNWHRTFTLEEVILNDLFDFRAALPPDELAELISNALDALPKIVKELHGIKSEKSGDVYVQGLPNVITELLERFNSLLEKLVESTQNQQQISYYNQTASMNQQDTPRTTTRKYTGKTHSEGVGRLHKINKGKKEK